MNDPQGVQPTADHGSAYLLGQIDANVKHLLNSQKDLNDRLDRQDERITKVERGHWKIAGVASLIPTVIASIGIMVAYLKS